MNMNLTFKPLMNISFPDDVHNNPPAVCLIMVKHEFETKIFLLEGKFFEPLSFMTLITRSIW